MASDAKQAPFLGPFLRRSTQAPTIKAVRGTAASKGQAQILAVWIVAAKLPNSDLNLAVDFWMDFFVLFFPRKMGQNKQKKSAKKSPTKFTQSFGRNSSPRISVDNAFSASKGVFDN